MKRITFILTLLLNCLGLSSQSFELGAFAGISFYSGDLSPSRDILNLYLQTAEPAFGIFGRANLTEDLSLRLGYNRLAIRGDDEISGINRNLSFESTMNEGYLSIEFNLGYLPVVADRLMLVPYLFGGGAFFTFNPTANANGQKVDLQPLGTEAQGQPGYAAPYELNGLAILGGGGLKLILNDKLTLGFELGARKTFTDYLDDVSATDLIYGDVLQNGSLAASLSNPDLDPDITPLNQSYKRGGERKDWYFAGGLTLSYTLGGHKRSGGVRGSGKQMKCYTF